MDYEPVSIQRYDDWSVDSVKLVYLTSFIERCKERGVRLVFTVSPWYGRETDTEYGVLKDLAARYDIPVLNHFNDERFVSDKSLFAEQAHLNESGARLYSEIISHELRTILSNE